MKLGSKIIHIIISKEFILRVLVGNQINMLVDKGWIVHLYFDQDKSWNGLRKLKDVHIHQIEFERKISLLKDFKALLKLLKFLKKSEGLICYSTPKASLIGALASFILSKKATIYFMRGRIYENFVGVKRIIYEFIERFICFASKKVVFLTSDHLKEFIVNNIISKNKGIIIHNGSSNGIDLEHYNLSKSERINLKKDLGYNVNDIVLVFLGRVCDDKGFFDFINVTNNLSSEIKNLKILIIGKNELSSPVYSFIPENMKPVVKILDWIPNPEKYLQISDILLLPSKREGFGNVYLESSAASCVPVGYNILGVKSAVINNQTGVLVPLQDLDKLYEACRSLIQDTDFRKKLVLNGKKHALKFDRKRFHRELLKFYESELP